MSEQGALPNELLQQPSDRQMRAQREQGASAGNVAMLSENSAQCSKHADEANGCSHFEEMPHAMAGEVQSEASFSATSRAQGPELPTAQSSNHLTAIFSAGSDTCATSMDAVEWSALRLRAFSVARSQHFESLTVLLIWANACLIGVETEHHAKHLTDERTFAMEVTSWVIFCGFCLELALRVFVSASGSSP